MVSGPGVCWGHYERIGIMDVLVTTFGEPEDKQAEEQAYADVVNVLFEVVPGPGFEQTVLQSNKCVTGKVWNDEHNKAVFFVRVVGKPYYVYFPGSKHMSVKDVDILYVKAAMNHGTVMVTTNRRVLEKFIRYHFA